MERLLMNNLVKWKNSAYRKPLVLKGARQCGKTWILKEFGKQYYKNTAYINFDEHEEYKQFFQTSKDVKRIIQNLQMAIGEKIEPIHTLLFFDEIQECPQALNVLKYFCENAPEYHIVSAGSLLGVTLAKSTGFPVGKVDFLDLKPMSFTEFLLANGDKNLVSYMSSIDSIEPIPDAFFNPLLEKLKIYYITGGMPEAVLMWIKEYDIELVEYLLANILEAYERDFAKHAEIKDFSKISLIWKSIPSQLARENKKFLYTALKTGARAREYENALQWLIDAGLAYKIYRMNGCGLPLAAYDDMSAFKLYMMDIGLLRKLSNLAPSVFNEGTKLFVEFKGALSENYILQSLQNLTNITPRYWSIDNPRYEVDFIIQLENDIFPIEVKAGKNIKSTSLKKYNALYQEHLKLRVRFSLENLKLDDQVLNIPLCMADQTDHFIKLAIQELEEKSRKHDK